MNTITYMRLNSFTAEQYRIDVIKFFTCSKINIARAGRESITWRNDAFSARFWKLNSSLGAHRLQRLRNVLYRFNQKWDVWSQKKLHSRFCPLKHYSKHILFFNFDQFWGKSKIRFEHDLTGNCLSHVKTKTGFVLRRSRAFRKTCFYFILSNFDENTKWREDDVIPETVNINGSISSAIPDIPLRFYTSDRKFKKIR